MRDESDTGHSERDQAQPQQTNGPRVRSEVAPGLMNRKPELQEPRNQVRKFSPPQLLERGIGLLLMVLK